MKTVASRMVELRSEFQFILSIDDYSVESLIFEGEEYMK